MPKVLERHDESQINKTISGTQVQVEVEEATN